MSILTYLTGLIVGMLFVVSGLYKIRSGDSGAQIARYEILPDPLVRIAAVSLPLGELIVGVSLSSGIFARPALILAAVMLLAFCVGIVVNLCRGRHIDCGCRSDDKPISWSLATQDAVLGAACLIAATQPTAGPWHALTGSGATGVSDAVATTVATLLAWVLWQLLLGATTARRLLTSEGIRS